MDFLARACSLLALLCLVTSAAFAADTPAARRAAELLNRPVAEASGKPIGDLRDLVIDMAEARVTALVIGVGWRDGKERLVARRLEAGASFDGQRITLPPGKPPQAREFDEHRWPSLERFASAERSSPVSWPGDASAKPVARASVLMKAPFRDAQGEVVGQVRDLLVDISSGSVRNVVVEFDPDWYGSGGWVALPLASVRRSGQDLVAAFEPEYIRPVDGTRAQPRKPKAPAPTLDRDFRLSRLIGRKVVDSQRRAIGTLSDFTVDAAGARLTHAVIDLGNKRVAYPMPLAGATLDGEAIVLDASRARIDALPAPPKAARARPASRLLRADIADYTGADVGDIRDLVGNPATGELRYAVAEFDPSWVQTGKLVTVPMGEVTSLEGRNGIAMRADLNALNGAMLFDKGKWPDINGPAYRKYVDGYLARH